jgi:hypothetical protein
VLTEVEPARSTEEAFLCPAESLISAIVSQLHVFIPSLSRRLQFLCPENGPDPVHELIESQYGIEGLILPSGCIRAPRE